MFGIHDFGLFFVSALLLNVAPGPDTAYVAGRSVQLGWRGVAIVTARAAGHVRNSGRAMVLINRSLGALFVYLGVRIAFAQVK